METQLFPGPGLCTTLLIRPVGDTWSVLHEQASTWTNDNIGLTWSWLWVFCCCPTRKGAHCPVYAVMYGRFHPHCQAGHVPVAGPCLLGSRLKRAVWMGAFSLRDSPRGLLAGPLPHSQGLASKPVLFRLLEA